MEEFWIKVIISYTMFGLMWGISTVMAWKYDKNGISHEYDSGQFFGVVGLIITTFVVIIN